MYKLRIVQSGKEYDYEPGASLLEILLAQNIFIDNPCNGKGVCGKCKVRIVSGEVGEVSSTELLIYNRTFRRRAHARVRE